MSQTFSYERLLKRCIFWIFIIFYLLILFIYLFQKQKRPYIYIYTQKKKKTKKKNIYIKPKTCIIGKDKFKTKLAQNIDNNTIYTISQMTSMT